MKIAEFDIEKNYLVRQNTMLAKLLWGKKILLKIPFIRGLIIYRDYQKKKLETALMTIQEEQKIANEKVLYQMKHLENCLKEIILKKPLSIDGLPYKINASDNISIKLQERLQACIEKA